MRLDILENGHTFFQKLQLKIIKLMMGEITGPISVLSYNRNFFGKHYTIWLQNSMRNMKHWTIRDVELMGAFVSKNNECAFCFNGHVAVTKNFMQEDVILTIIKNFETAPINNKMKSILKFIKKLTLNPSELNKEDVTPLIKEGLSYEAIEEAIHVCGVFCTINRLADAFNFEAIRNLDKAGKFLFKRGYTTTSLWG